MLSGYHGRFPDFPLILSHLGGNAPQIMERIAMAAARGRAAKPPLDYFRNSCYDTAGSVPPQSVSSVQAAPGLPESGVHKLAVIRE